MTPAQKSCCSIFILAVIVLIFAGCKKEEPAYSDNNGVHEWQHNVDLTGDTVVIYQYADSVITNTFPCNDTLVFLNDSLYSWNDSIAVYHASENMHDDVYALVLTYTRFGALDLLAMHTDIPWVAMNGHIGYGSLQPAGHNFYYWTIGY